MGLARRPEPADASGLSPMARTRYSSSQANLPLGQLPAAALRAVLREGYTAQDFRADLVAGVVVGIVALPLAMALAIAVGVAPQYGLATAIVAGCIAALLGGSRTQVTGPTAAFVVVLAPIHAQFGLGGLLVSGLMAGLFLVLMGVARLGRLIEFVPYPVTTGFTTGIAVVIAVLQLKDLFGLSPSSHGHSFPETAAALIAAAPTFRPWELGVGLTTLGLLLVLPRLTKRVPAALVALPAAALLGALLEALVPSVELVTIGRRFGAAIDGTFVPGIPQAPPQLMWPWQAVDAGGAALPFDGATVRALLPGALAIAVLGAIESLLSAVVADGMARTRHDPDAELIGQGVSNLIAPFFGGIAATGALARTATNIRCGARSPVAAVTHALTVLAAVLLLAPMLEYLPMAALAALLLIVAWNMSEARHFVHLLRVAPGSDVVILLTCFLLTVVFDMVVGVSVGVVLAALLFMRRMAEMTQVRLASSNATRPTEPLPPGVIVYEISGPLFFGAAHKAMSTVQLVASDIRVVVLDMSDVDTMDVTGLVALESALSVLQSRGARVVLSGLRPQPGGLLEKADLAREYAVHLCANSEDALAFATDLPAEKQMP